MCIQNDYMQRGRESNIPDEFNWIDFYTGKIEYVCSIKIDSSLLLKNNLIKKFKRMQLKIYFDYDS